MVQGIKEPRNGLRLTAPRGLLMTSSRLLGGHRVPKFQKEACLAQGLETVRGQAAARGAGSHHTEVVWV